MKGLSDRQQQILEFIRGFINENVYPPTIRDIQHGCAISSTSVVDYNLNALTEKGYLGRRADVSRGIVLLDEGRTRVRSVETVAVPLMGVIAAGAPITLPSADTVASAEEFVDLPQSIIGRGDSLYALRVRGESMIDALIADGDLVVMEQTSEVENGRMAAVRLKLENETTLKQIYSEGATVRLQPANSQMDPIRVPADNVEILSRVVAVWRYMG